MSDLICIPWKYFSLHVTGPFNKSTCMLSWQHTIMEGLEHTLPSMFGNWVFHKLLLEMVLRAVCFVQDVLKYAIPEKPRADFLMCIVPHYFRACLSVKFWNRRKFWDHSGLISETSSSYMMESGDMLVHLTLLLTLNKTLCMHTVYSFDTVLTSKGIL